MEELPVVCERDELTAKERARQRELFSELAAAVSEIHEVEEGLVLRLPTEKITKAAELMSLEKRCCRFLNLRLEAAASEHDVSLILTGPPGTKALLRSELAEARTNS